MNDIEREAQIRQEAAHWHYDKSNDEMVLIRLLDEARAQSGWRPIETAPKDGTKVLVFCPHDSPFQAVANYHRQESPEWVGWVESYDGEDIWPPSHWMPLPPAPPITEKEHCR